MQMKQADIAVPRYAADVMERLEADGYEAYAVGGCIRDSLLGRRPNDWDITTSAHPDAVMRLFGGKDRRCDAVKAGNGDMVKAGNGGAVKAEAAVTAAEAANESGSTDNRFRAYPTGIAHGTVTVLSSGEPVEVTTYRIDGEYRDSRRPESVDFNAGLSDDLARRDFTVNAMAYSPKRGFCDIFHGREDLQNRIIRCVGEPEKRFSEDALRILRAVRFASVLGFVIDDACAEAAAALRENLNAVSRERIQAELVKFLYGDYAPKLIDGFRPIFETILPDMNPNAGVFLDKIHNLWKTLGEKYRMYHSEDNPSVKEAAFSTESSKEATSSTESVKKTASSAESVKEATSSAKPSAEATSSTESVKKTASSAESVKEATSSAKPSAEAASSAESAKETTAKPSKESSKLLSDELPLLLAAVVSGKNAEPLLDSLRLDKKTRKRASLICGYADYRLPGTDTADGVALTKLCAAVGWESAWDIVVYAAAVGNMPPEAVGNLVKIRKNHVCIRVSELAVTGNDLKELGYRGNEVGQEQKRLLYAVIENKIVNEKETLLAFAMSDRTNESGKDCL